MDGFRHGQKQEHKQPHNRWKPMAVRLITSTALGLVLLTGLLAAAAAVCLRLDVPQAVLPWVAIPLAGAAAFAAAVFFVSAERRQGLVTGILTAAVLYVFVLAAALVFSKAALGMNAVLLLLVMLLCGAAGGVFAANRISEPKRRRAKKKHTGAQSRARK